MNIDRYGNTSSGSIPLALDEAWRAGRIGPGSTVVVCGFGGGLAWGSAVWRL
jgi:3-oxoacyl-[acyl-carrier-protein] synthase-3